MAAIGFVLFKVHGFYQIYSKNEFRTEIRMVDVESLTLPKIQVCGKYHEINNGRICFKNKTKMGNLCIKDYFNIFHLNGSRISQSDDMIFPASCVTMSTKEVFVANSKESLEFTFDMSSEDEWSEYQFSVGVGNFDEESLDYIHSGSWIIHILNVQFINRLRAPFNSNCTSDDDNTLNIFPGPYTIRKCKAHLMFKHMLEKCGDVPDNLKKYVRPGQKTGWDFNNKTRNESNVRSCIEFWSTNHPYKTVSVSQCPLPCREIIFETNIEKLHDGYRSVRFYVQYRSRRITEITEVPVYTSDHFFSDVGSWLGLMVGMSLLSLAEIATFILIIILEQCTLLKM